MTKDDIIKVLENWYEENKKRQNTSEAKETMVSYDFIYAYANIDIKYFLNFINSLDQVERSNDYE